jgi:tRNA threonylcarbamoyladenosine dehydratase
MAAIAALFVRSVQMRFQRFQALVGTQSIQQLHRKSVMVVGLGGVGSFAAEALARSGIGHLILVDHDVIDITNINRQLIALEETIGLSKVEVMKTRILAINPEAKVTAIKTFFDDSTMEEILALNPDFIVDAIDSMHSKLLLISTAVSRKIPIIASMGFACKLHPESIELSTLQKTEMCPLAKEIRYRFRKAGLTLNIPVVYSKEIPIESKDDAIKLGSSAFVPPVAGLMMASYVVNQIISKEELTK